MLHLTYSKLSWNIPTSYLENNKKGFLITLFEKKKKKEFYLSLSSYIETIHGFNNNTITLNLEATER